MKTILRAVKLLLFVMICLSTHLPARGGQWLDSDEVTQALEGNDLQLQRRLIEQCRFMAQPATKAQAKKALNMLRTTEVDGVSRKARIWMANMIQFGLDISGIILDYYESNSTLEGLASSSEYKSWYRHIQKQNEALLDSQLAEEIETLKQNAR